MTINEKLRALMHDRKMTVIARRAGIKYPSLYQYVNQDAMPGAGTALRIAKAIGVEVEWLLDDTQGWPPKLKYYGERQRRQFGRCACGLSERNTPREIQTPHFAKNG